jgi:hypothetical protein
MAGVRKLIEQEQLDCSPAQLALAWCLANPHVNSVVVGARCKSSFVLLLVGWPHYIVIAIQQLQENIVAVELSRRLFGDDVERDQSNEFEHEDDNNNNNNNNSDKKKKQTSTTTTIKRGRQLRMALEELFVRANVSPVETPTWSRYEKHHNKTK